MIEEREERRKKVGGGREGERKDANARSTLDYLQSYGLEHLLE